VTHPRISRRTLLLLPAVAAVSCRPPRAQAYQAYCFVANRDGRSIAVVDLAVFRVRKQIPLDAAPSAVVAHPKHTKIFVLAPDAGAVYEIDCTKLAVTRRASAGKQAIGMRMAPQGNALWVLYRDPAALVEIPLDSFHPGRHVRLTSPPDSFDVTAPGAATGPHAAIASAAGRSIALVSLETATIERTIDAGVEPSLVVFRRDGRLVMAGSAAERSLSAFETAGGKTVVRLPLPFAPRQFCTNSDGGQLFLSGDGMDAVVVVFPYSTEIWQTVLAGRAPGAMAVTDAPYLMVANPQTNTLTVLDVNIPKLVAVVEVGAQPGQVLITPSEDPQQQYALVLNEGSGDMAVIRTWSLGAPRLNEEGARFKSAPLFTMIPVGERPVAAAVVPWI
jgi:DNA-binding beta-propeller fold protein YncE